MKWNEAWKTIKEITHTAQRNTSTPNNFVKVHVAYTTRHTCFWFDSNKVQQYGALLLHGKITMFKTSKKFKHWSKNSNKKCSVESDNVYNKRVQLFQATCMKSFWLDKYCKVLQFYVLLLITIARLKHCWYSYTYRMSHKDILSRKFGSIKNGKVYSEV